jgi:exosome complex component RRP46
MLLSESDGKFSYEEWSEACQMAEEACCGEEEEEEEGGVKLEAEGEAMDIDAQVEGENLEKWLRSVVRRKVEGEQRWKSAT